MKRKIWGLVLVMCMLAAFVPCANATEIVDSGDLSDSIIWTVDDKGILTISGVGDMPDYDKEITNTIPWYRYKYSITSIVVESGITAIGDYVFYDCVYAKSVKLPDRVTSIGDYAFSWCGFNSVEIPDSVTSIGDYAFSWCHYLTDITIGSDTTSIGNMVFFDCTSLAEINIDINNSAYYAENGILFNKEKNELIFYSQKKSGSYIVPDSVTYIHDYAFYGCDDLTGIEIPDSVIDIGEYAFSCCRGLKSIEIPGSVTDIKEGILSHCIYLENITIGEGVQTIGNHAFNSCSGLFSIEIPDSVTAIQDYAFFYCRVLSSIKIPDSVIDIGDSAFSWCDSLSDVCYAGTREEWSAVEIGKDNNELLNATTHFNATGMNPPQITGTPMIENNVITVNLADVEYDSELITVSL
ncbi:MAG: leucine-rich repeat domain-containing protein [Clostridia bacterium]